MIDIEVDQLTLSLIVHVNSGQMFENFPSIMTILQAGSVA